MRSVGVVSLVGLIVGVGILVGGAIEARQAGKILISHRGASAYAPENTLPSYELAIQQGADYVEQDLQVTKDGVLMCLHDLTLERTTDVEDVFPARFREVTVDGKAVKQWPVADFTAAEIKRLDAGSWKDPKFAGTRIPTWQEAIDFMRGKAGLYPETKAPEVYGKLGFDMERLVLDQLKKNKLDIPGVDPKTPVIIQSFSAASLKKMTDELKTKVPLVYLLDGGAENQQYMSADGITKVKAFASGIGPNKNLVLTNPDLVTWAHRAGLTVTCWTFRSANTGTFASVKEEMSHYLYTLKIDALFTDNPDQFPRQK
ncbi:MAG: glycerophosphodiester phosphodiesterase family protein [Acidobacteria bacterium]|nr:glycerophosphodiester phosphodiesterase family protein [Acidobacteriota bacterium]